MIKQVRMKFFRRHENLSVNFQAGLTTLRAENEGGKTTVIEAVLYALYGTRALRSSLKETVTWGEPDRKLSVEVDIEIGKQTYTFTRAKSGAEVLVDGKLYVSGQTEVTNFASNLLGADLATARNLMIADQNGLRGALGAGPKAAAEMVEGLADFGLFDKLLERASERLVLGSDVSIQQRLTEALERKEIEEAREIPSIKEFEEVIKTNPVEISKIEAHLQKELYPARTAAQKNLDEARSRRSQFDLLTNSIKTTTNQRDQAITRKIAAQERIVEVDTDHLKVLEAQVEAAKTLDLRRRVFEELKQLNKQYPETYWAADIDDFREAQTNAQQELERVQSLIDASIVEDLKKHLQELEFTRSKVESKIQTDDTCSACGQLLQNHEEIAEQNAKLKGEISELAKKIKEAKQDYEEENKKLEALQKQRDEARETIQTLNTVEVSARPFYDFLNKHHEFILSDDSVYPPKLSWKGEEPSDKGKSVSELQKEIRDIQTQIETVEQARADLKAATQLEKDYNNQLKELQEQQSKIELIELSAAQDLADKAQQEVATAELQIARLKEEITKAETEIKLVEQQRKHKEENLKELDKAIDALNQELKDLAFNNELIKRIRALRPVVANQLWNKVLSAVSTMFSQMRGTQSVVTRDKDGFKVNGQDVSSLSGSTLDLLGLAIRVALIKTFLPNCPLLILDEPFAAADLNRTMEALAFLKSLEIPQVILITHEEISETVAEDIIELVA